MDINVRLSETDKLGNINHVNYFVYMEEARIRFLQNHGLMEKSEHHVFLLASVQSDFIRQGYFGQTLSVDVKVIKVGNKSLTVGQSIFSKETGELIAKGEAVLVFFDMKKQVSIPLSDDMKEKLLGSIV